ncbi:hypothetical protein ACOME3_005255 [Neoechinorhynchus agilis]
MKLRQLESKLQNVQLFDSCSSRKLEQYSTPPDLAARLLHSIRETDLRESDTIADFGCGTGILGIGLGLLGAKYIVGFDICPFALEQAKTNAYNVLDDQDVCIDFVLCDLTCGLRGSFDLIVMNPPFGTYSPANGVDLAFLKEALRCSRSSVYSFHKTSTRKFVVQKGYEFGSVNVEPIATLEFPIEKINRYKKRRGNELHNYPLKLIEVDVIRFVKKNDD